MSSTSLSESSVPQEEVIATFLEFFARRAKVGVMIAKAVTSVIFMNGVVTITFDPAAIGWTRKIFDELTPSNNLATFVAAPVAFNDATGKRVRPLIKSIKTQYPDGTSLGELDHVGILALNELDK